MFYTIEILGVTFRAHAAGIVIFYGLAFFVLLCAEFMLGLAMLEQIIGGRRKWMGPLVFTTVIVLAGLNVWLGTDAFFGLVLEVGIIGLAIWVCWRKRHQIISGIQWMLEWGVKLLNLILDQVDRGLLWAWNHIHALRIPEIHRPQTLKGLLPYTGGLRPHRVNAPMVVTSEFGISARRWDPIFWTSFVAFFALSLSIIKLLRRRA